MLALRKVEVLIIWFLMVPPAVGVSFPVPFQALTPGEQQADLAYESGMKLLREKRYREALDQFQLLEKDKPQLPQGYSGEGLALALMGRLEDATHVLSKALDIDPTFWVARRGLGIIDWQLKKKDEAANELRTIVKLFPDDSAVNAILGQYESEHGNYPQASAYFEKAKVEVAADVRLSLMAAEAHVKTGKQSRAKDILETLIANPTLTPQQRFQLGWQLGEAGDYQKSIQVLVSLPEDFPDKFERGYSIALAYYKDGQYSNCIKVLSDLKNRQIIRPELFSLLGAAEENGHNTLEAYNAFREGIYAFPTDDENYLNITTVSAAHLNYDLAAQILTSGTRLIPNDYKLYLARGVVFTLGRHLESAHADYEKALALAPNEGEVYVALGICYMDQNKFDEAAATFRQGILHQPKDALLHYFLADSLFREGISVDTPGYREALSAVESSLAFNPDFPYAYLQRARLELMRPQVDKAVEDLERARSLAPDSREISYQLAIAYRQAGRKAEAEKLFKTVSEASEKDAAEFRGGQLRDVIITLSNPAHSAE